MVRSTIMIAAALSLDACGTTPPAQLDGETITVSADALAKAFSDNAVGAKATYSGTVIIEGAVEKVSQDVTGVANVTLAADAGPIGAGMVAEATPWAASLRPGTRVAVLCNAPRYFLGAVIASGCSPQVLQH